MPHKRHKSDDDYYSDALSLCATLCCGLIFIGFFLWIALWPIAVVHDDVHHDDPHHHHHDDAHVFSAQVQSTAASNTKAQPAVLPHKNQKTIGPLQQPLPPPPPPVIVVNNISA